MLFWNKENIVHQLSDEDFNMVVYMAGEKSINC